ncbi:LLM class flavin-dependent oxidoreductase [Bradyrhizobium sp. SSUT77]|uniref:LLM class flavin-dependent oxidoreductase n=1 Tax=Bradyrhizobium sp. SSUT77 TaxID=3040603 RepID=UPI0032659231
MSRQMNIGVFVIGTGNHVSGWRLPGAFKSHEDFSALLEITQLAEDSKLDFVFFADAPTAELDGHPGQAARLEPITLISALAARTRNIGLVATVSTTYMEPYNLARLVLSADKISGGRVGWNVVTTAQQSDNFDKKLPPHAVRYEIAAEYLDVVQGLWDSWESDALLYDVETGTFFDRSKVHAVNHQGKFFKVKGPLGISRSPQGQPVIVQAGSSASGQHFAAKYAEIVFTIQQDIEEARTFYKKMKDQVEAAGRSRDCLKILPGFFPIVGRTEEEAKAKYDELVKLIEPGSALKIMSDRLGHDMSKFRMDGPLPDLPLSEEVQSFLTVLYAKARRENLILREIHDLFAVSRGYILVYGTAGSIVDVMQQWVQTEACDGFMIAPAYFRSL